MKILFVSLGCDKNLVDTEEMLAMLSRRGYSFTDDEEEADIAVVNTCCFIGDAKKESIDTLLELGQRRTDGRLKALIAAGCLAQRYKDEIADQIPEVDAIIGTTAQEALADALDDVLSGAGPGSRIHVDSLKKAVDPDRKRILTTGGYYGYLKIAEGCNKGCSYCVIPSVRGPYRSAPMEGLVRQAKALADQGVRELILVAQETTLYGMDLYGDKKLPELLHRLGEIDGIAWIRILYAYPEEITPEIVRAIRDEPKVVHYLDMPIQSASDEILARMGRRTNRKQLEERIEMIRREIPDICLRTTLIAGFPGEREEDHRQTLDFIRRIRFDRLGVFPYSREEGTPAWRMKGQIPAPVRKKRVRELMLAQQKIAFETASASKGRTMEALVEGKLADEDVYVARTYRDAPGVDGMVFIETAKELMTGDLVRIEITGSVDYDLVGRLSQS